MRRRYYRLTTEGRRVLALQTQKSGKFFVGAVGRVAGVNMSEWKREIRKRFSWIKAPPGTGS